MRFRITVAAACGLATLASAGVAEAEPFYGYSGYYGGPAPYYTPTPDVHQATTPREGYLGFGVVTYTPGGPFWGYRPAGSSYRVRYRRHERYPLRVRG